MAPSSPSAARLVQLSVAALGVACGVSVWSIAHGSGAFTTYGGRSELAATTFVAAGLALITAGLLVSVRRRFLGALSVVAGVIWFAPAWEGWEGGPSLARAAAMPVARMLFPVLLNLVVIAVMPTMSRITLFVVASTYALAGTSAVLLALVRDPYLDPNCFADCTTHLFVIWSRPQLAHAVVTASAWFTMVAAAALIAICVSWWWRSPANRRRQWLVLTGGVILGVATIVQSVLILSRGFEDPATAGFQIAFLARCAASLTIAAGLVWAGFYSRLVRRAVARVVARLDDAALTGSLESALARATRDPSLKVAYWLPAVGRYSDSDGRPVDQTSSGVRIDSTSVVRNGTPVAVISHSSDAAELERVLGSDLRLALDNERLRAEVLAQMTDLRESRTRIVAAGDERRRQLERNLHDGAQQSLLGLTYDLRRARAAAAANEHDDVVELCDHAVNEVGQAFAELRDLAHGIFPAVLSHAGLAAAVTSVAETAPIPVDVDCTVTERLRTDVETAVYVVVADGIDAVSQSGATSATVTIGRQQTAVVVEVTPDRLNRFPDMVHLADRVGAVGGTMSTAQGSLRAEIPCAW